MRQIEEEWLVLMLVDETDRLIRVLVNQVGLIRL